MNFARLSPGGSIVKFPVDIRTEYRAISWPAKDDDITDAMLPKDIVRVKDGEKPTDPFVRITGEKLEKRQGVWWRLYLTAKWTSKEIADYRKAEVAAHRWNVETGGLTISALNVTVETSIDSQNRISSIITHARLAGITSVNFKALSGWVTLTIEQVEAIARAVALHVQACFSAENAHSVEIDKLLLKPNAFENLVKYDVKANWPNAVI